MRAGPTPCSPRVRGWSRPLVADDREVILLPAPARMVPAGLWLDGQPVTAPCTREDGPAKGNVPDAVHCGGQGSNSRGSGYSMSSW